MGDGLLSRRFLECFLPRDEINSALSLVMVMKDKLRIGAGSAWEVVRKAINPLLRRLPQSLKVPLKILRAILQEELRPIRRPHISMGSSDWADAASDYLDFFESARDRVRRDLLDAIILELLQPVEKCILDLGCGEGYLVRTLKTLGAKKVVGLDVAEKLVLEAKRKNPQGDYRLFDICRDEIEETAAFDSVIANMFLMDVPDLRLVYRKICKWLRPGGQFVASLINPCYTLPVAVWKLTCRNIISGQSDPSLHITNYFEPRDVVKHFGSSTVHHYHRPLNEYLNLAKEHGLFLKSFHEPKIS